MFGKKRPRVGRRKRRAPGHRWWSALAAAQRRWIFRTSLYLVMAVAFLATVAAGMTQLEAHVERKLLTRVAQPVLTFVGLPDPLDALARADLSDSVTDLLDANWVKPGLCRDMAERLGAVAWVKEVLAVRKTGYGRVEVWARYRLPFAMVQRRDTFVLVDADAVRLPGRYSYDSRWTLIQGVSQPAPPPGALWPGEDLAAAIRVISAIRSEAFQDQITGVLVENHAGRLDPGASHILLATDRAGGRIGWGSAPGAEIEENSVEEKLAILRSNHARTGRVDAHHPMIGVSTFPDRFTVPQ